MRQLTRREFLKLSGGGLLAFSFFQLPGLWQLAPTASPLPPAQGYSISPGAEWCPNVCTLCSKTCGIRVAVKSFGGLERAVKIEGNPYHPYNLGKICARGQSGLDRVYSLSRIRTPLIRVPGSKRGEWAFRQASWDEAYEYITGTLKQGQIHPYEIGLVGGWITCSFYRTFIIALAQALGSPNVLGTPMQHCVMGEHFGIDSVTGNFNVHDELMAGYAHADYLLAFRSNASILGTASGRGGDGHHGSARETQATERRGSIQACRNEPGKKTTHPVVPQSMRCAGTRRIGDGVRFLSYAFPRVI